jgi:hypothetical protein
MESVLLELTTRALTPLSPRRSIEGGFKWQPLHTSTGTVTILQLRVLRLGFFQDGDVGVGVFPDGGEAVTAASPYV